MNCLDLETYSAEAMQRILSMQHRERASACDQTKQPLYAYGMLLHFERKKLRELDLFILETMQTINQYEADITAMLCNCYTVVKTSAHDKRRSILQMSVGNFDKDNELYMRRLLLRKLKAKYDECATAIKHLHTQAMQRHIAYSTGVSAIRMNLQPTAMPLSQNVQNVQNEPNDPLLWTACGAACEVCAVASDMTQTLRWDVFANEGNRQYPGHVPGLF